MLPEIFYASEYSTVPDLSRLSDANRKVYTYNYPFDLKNALYTLTEEDIIFIAAVLYKDTKRFNPDWKEIYKVVSYRIHNDHFYSNIHLTVSWIYNDSKFSSTINIVFDNISYECKFITNTNNNASFSQSLEIFTYFSEIFNKKIYESKDGQSIPMHPLPNIHSYDNTRLKDRFLNPPSRLSDFKNPLPV